MFGTKKSAITIMLGQEHPKEKYDVEDFERLIRRKKIIAFFQGMGGFVITTIAMSFVFYFIYKELLMYEHLKLIISILFSFFNYVALGLSWNYFRSSLNASDEGNSLMGKCYTSNGINMCHIIILIGRTFINFMLIFTLYGETLAIFEDYLLGNYVIYPNLYFYCLLTGMWFGETAFNAVNTRKLYIDFINDPHGTLQRDINFEKNESCKKYGRLCEEPQIEEIIYTLDYWDDKYFGNLFLPDAPNKGNIVYIGTEENPIKLTDLDPSIKIRTAKLFSRKKNKNKFSCIFKD